jgi:hypothetical protein
MNELSTRMGSSEVARNGSIKDFNSENAYCEQLSNGVGPPEVEILGMDLLLKDDRSTIDDDSDLDSTEDRVVNNLQTAVDSLVLTRRRLPNIVVHRCPRKTQTTKRVRFPRDEVDSLVLTRERLHHIARDKTQDHKLYLDQLFGEGRGLMGEIDSLILDRRRLSHFLHKREALYADDMISWTRNPTKASKVQGYELPLNDLAYSETPDAVSLSSSGSGSTIDLDDSLFTADTVDSIILSRRRLALHSTRNQSASRTGEPPILQLLRNSEPPSSKIPPTWDVGLDFGLRRSSPGAIAA